MGFSLSIVGMLFIYATIVSLFVLWSRAIKKKRVKIVLFIFIGFFLGSIIFNIVGHNMTVATCTHKEMEVVSEVNASCVSEGQIVYVCKVCGEQEIENRPISNEHSWIEATCTEAKMCSVCGIKDGEPIDHIPGEWIVVKEATKKKKGLKEKHCTICDEVVASKKIPTKK